MVYISPVKFAITDPQQNTLARFLGHIFNLKLTLILVKETLKNPKYPATNI